MVLWFVLTVTAIRQHPIYIIYITCKNRYSFVFKKQYVQLLDRSVCDWKGSDNHIALFSDKAQ